MSHVSLKISPIGHVRNHPFEELPGPPEWPQFQVIKDYIHDFTESGCHWTKDWGKHRCKTIWFSFRGRRWLITRRPGSIFTERFPFRRLVDCSIHAENLVGQWGGRERELDNRFYNMQAIWACESGEVLRQYEMAVPEEITMEFLRKEGLVD